MSSEVVPDMRQLLGESTWPATVINPGSYLRGLHLVLRGYGTGPYELVPPVPPRWRRGQQRCREVWWNWETRQRGRCRRACHSRGQHYARGRGWQAWW